MVFVHEDDADPLLESGLQVPGGGVGPGETPDEAALREAHEETGLEDLESYVTSGTTCPMPGQPRTS